MAKTEEQNKEESIHQKIAERQLKNVEAKHTSWAQSILEESKDLMVFIFSETLAVLVIMASLWFTEKVVLEFLFGHEAPPAIELIVYISTIAITIAYVVGVLVSLYRYIRTKALAWYELERAILFRFKKSKDGPFFGFLNVRKRTLATIFFALRLAFYRKRLRRKSMFSRDTNRDTNIVRSPTEYDFFMQTDIRIRTLANAVIKRAQRIMPILKGANILWIDDHPENNVSEIKVMETFGILVQKAGSSPEALRKLEKKGFDVIISDIERAENSTEGIRFLNEVIRPLGLGQKTIFFIFNLEPHKGPPPGSAGIADWPVDLLHHVMDVIERNRG